MARLGCGKMTGLGQIRPHTTMNRLINLILCCGIGTAVGCAEEPFDPNNPSDFDRKVIAFVGSESAVGSWVNNENRDLVIQRLKAMRLVPNTKTRDDSIDSALVALGDEEATARVAEQRIEGGGGFAASHLTEIALPYMVNALYTADSKIIAGGDVIHPSSKQSIVMSFLSIIRRSRQFPDETRQWAWETLNAPRILPEEEVETQAELAQQWWEHNEKAVMEKRYRDATWLPAMAVAKNLPPMPDPDDARRTWPPKPQNQGAVAMPQRTSATAAATTGVAHTSEAQNRILIGFVATLSGVAVWLIARARRKS